MKTEFKHIYIPGDEHLPVLLLLHGTGGDEQDLVEIGRAVSPGSAILSVRGKVLENGMPRFFRRLSEGVFDLEDLKFRTDELTEFIGEARKEYNLINKDIFALGFSNGANIAASILLSHPDILQGAILLRAMVPFVPETLPNLSSKKILMLSGLMDPIIPVDQSKHLARLFEEAGSDIDLRIKPAGHGLIQSDFSDITSWLNTKAIS